VETELSNHSDNYEVRDDSLWTTVDRIDQLGLDSPSGSTLTLTVLSELNNVWRGRGLIATGNDLVAIWPSQNNDGQQLNAGILGPVTSSRQGEAPQNGSGDSRDVSQQAAVLFGGSQHFDDRNGTLEVCLTLANRGKTAFRIPIDLEAEDIRSPLAEVSILNASNRLSGIGAKWDISSSVTGDEIPPGATSNPFCLALRLQLSSKGAAPSETDELVVLKLKVFASNERSAR
jgi:hypothetical protein